MQDARCNWVKVPVAGKQETKNWPGGGGGGRRTIVGVVFLLKVPLGLESKETGDKIKTLGLHYRTKYLLKNCTGPSALLWREPTNQLGGTLEGFMARVAHGAQVFLCWVGLCHPIP